MDGLNDEERALAWKANWNPSFSGIAIVNKDFTFRSANPQFCKLLGVTPADLIGKRFQDVTPPRLKELDEKNAQMLIDGLVDFYILPKKYAFASGHEVEVVLLVTRAPPAIEGEFQFFVSRIMLDESGEVMEYHTEKEGLQPTFPKPIKTVADFLMKYGVWVSSIGLLLGGMLLSIFQAGALN